MFKLTGRRNIRTWFRFDVPVVKNFLQQVIWNIKNFRRWHSGRCMGPVLQFINISVIFQILRYPRRSRSWNPMDSFPFLQPVGLFGRPDGQPYLLFLAKKVLKHLTWGPIDRLWSLICWSSSSNTVLHHLDLSNNKSAINFLLAPRPCLLFLSFPDTF